MFPLRDGNLLHFLVDFILQLLQFFRQLFLLDPFSFLSFLVDCFRFKNFLIPEPELIQHRVNVFMKIIEQSSDRDT